METTVDRYGRVVTPKKIRDHYDVEPGAQFRLEEKEGAIMLKPVPGEQGLKWKDGVVVFTGVPTGDLVEATSRRR
jgi:AbrB family looped-hinge helix DNA binding protein